MPARRLPRGTIKRRRRRGRRLGRILDRDPNPPIARTSDPDTSHRAQEDFILAAHAVRMKQVLFLVEKYPGRTNGEYARLMMKEFPDLPVKTCSETPHKRLSDLHARDLVEVTGTRDCRETGYQAQTWELTKVGVHEMRAVWPEDLE